MFGLILGAAKLGASWLASNSGSVISAGASLAPKLWQKHSAQSERRDFLDYQNAANYGYYLQSLRDSPSATREGLENAGYNPMLALGNVGSSSFSGGSANPPSDINGDFQALGLASAFQNLKKEKAETKKIESEAKLADDVQKTQSVKNKIERMLDFAKLDALEDDSYITPNSALSVKVGLTKMQELLARAFVDEWQLDAKEKQMMNSKEGLRALISEKMGRQAHSQIGKTIYDLLGDWLLDKNMKSDH